MSKILVSAQPLFEAEVVDGNLSVNDDKPIIAIINVETKEILAMKGQTVLPMRTPQGTVGIPVEIHFPKEMSVKDAFENYEKYAIEAIKEKKEEIEDQNRIVTASGNIPNNDSNEPLMFPNFMKR